jgi:hypothetical protein
MDPGHNSNSFILNPDNSGFGLASKDGGSGTLEKQDAFYSLCTTEKTCGGRLKYGRFKDRNHAIMCTLFGCMTFFVMVAVIVPLCIYALVDSGINDQVAIDGTGNPNYKSWQNNVVSPGSDVSVLSIFFPVTRFYLLLFASGCPSYLHFELFRPSKSRGSRGRWKAQSGGAWTIRVQ